MAINPSRHFQYLGCSGALAPKIKDNQVPKMQQSQAVMLSAGGNDAHLAVILNYCVYQWSAKWFWGCDGQILDGLKEVRSDDYSKNLRELLQAIEAKLIGKNSRIYWTGYMRFFDDNSHDCDAVTWAFTRVLGFRQYLTQERRYMTSKTQKVFRRD